MKKQNLQISLTIILAIINITLYAQKQTTDSLLVVLKSAKHDTTKLRILNVLANLETNTKISTYYDEQIENLVQENLALTSQFLIIISCKKYLASTIHRRGLICYNQGNIPKALEYYNKSLKIREELNDKIGISASLNNIGMIYKDLGDFNKAMEYYIKSLKICEELNDKKGSARSLNNIALIYADQGDIPNALEYFKKSLKIREELDDKINISNSLNNIGNIYSIQGDIVRALEYYNKSLKIREKLGDKSGISLSLQNIGAVYSEIGDISKALDCYMTSLKIRENIGDKNGISMSLNDIGNIYYTINDMSKALEYQNRSLKIHKELKDKRGIASSLVNIGNIYYELSCKEKSMNNVIGCETLEKKSLEYYCNSLKIYEELGDKNGISYSLHNIGFNFSEQAKSAKYRKDIVGCDILEKKALEYYNKSLKICEEFGAKSGISGSLISIGFIYLEREEILKALNCAKKGYNLAKEIGYIENIRDAAKLFEEIYFKQNNYKLSRQYYIEYITLRDSLTNEENKKLIQKKYFQYQYEKKAATDSIIHCKAMDIKNIEVKKQKTFIWFTVFGLMLVIVIAVVIFRSLRITRKQKYIIETQRDVVTQQKEEIETQRDLVTQQKEHIEHIHEELTDSIQYAERIQKAVLPTGEYADNILGNHFILFHPKDVVSGDFFWATRVNEWLIVTVADCTGHGVPGAFMSMLGISFLNEIVRKKEITKASQVLDNLRESVIDALKQHGTAGEQKDGMDMTLIAINSLTLEIQFAGANNPIYIFQNDLKELTEIKPDKMPVAIYENMKPFTNHIIQLQKDDIIYLASDGYEDQFGGPKHKKFLSKNLKELLKTNSQLLMTEQKEVLEKNLSNWKGDGEQIDDITVMGIKI